MVRPHSTVASPDVSLDGHETSAYSGDVHIMMLSDPAIPGADEDLESVDTTDLLS